MVDRCSIIYEPLKVELIEGKIVVKKMKILGIDFAEAGKHGIRMVS